MSQELKQLMKRPKSLSPSSLKLYCSEPDEFFLQKIAAGDVPKIPQSRAMVVGSAFDSYVKGGLSKHITGVDVTKQLFDDSVEFDPQWASINGFYLYQAYKGCGAFSSLIQDMSQCDPTTLRMENFLSADIQGVPICGKPDFSIEYKGCQDIGVKRFILDWKVNGYCSKTPPSPKKGYSHIIGGRWSPETRGDGKAHKDALIRSMCGIKYNAGHSLHDVDPDWAMQTAVYAWLFGSEVGEPVFAGIDQIACNTVKSFKMPLKTLNAQYGDEDYEFPAIRVASYRSIINTPFQLEAFQKFRKLWDIMTMDDDDLMRHYYSHIGLSEAESMQRCYDMLAQARIMQGADAGLLAAVTGSGREV